MSEKKKYREMFRKVLIHVDEHHDRLCECMQDMCGQCDLLKEIGFPKNPGNGYRLPYDRREEVIDEYLSKLDADHE